MYGMNCLYKIQGKEKLSVCCKPSLKITEDISKTYQWCSEAEFTTNGDDHEVPGQNSLLACLSLLNQSNFQFKVKCVEND